MEATCFAAREVCVGRFPRLPLHPHPPVGVAPSPLRHVSCGSCRSSDSENIPYTRHHSNPSGCFSRYRNNWLLTPRGQQQGLPDISVRSQLQQENQYPHQHHEVHWVESQKKTSPEIRGRGREARHQGCEEAVLGIDIPQVRAHLTCLVRHRTLEVYDTSPYPSCVIGRQALASCDVGRTGAKRDATAAAATTAEVTSAHGDAARVEATLERVAAAAPTLPCLLHVPLSAPLLSPTLFDAVLDPYNNVFCQRGRGSGSTKAASCSSASSTEGSSAGGKRERRCMTSRCNEVHKVACDAYVRNPTAKGSSRCVEDAATDRGCRVCDRRPVKQGCTSAAEDRFDILCKRHSCSARGGYAAFLEKKRQKGVRVYNMTSREQFSAISRRRQEILGAYSAGGAAGKGGNVLVHEGVGTPRAATAVAALQNAGPKKLTRQPPSDQALASHSTEDKDSRERCFFSRRLTRKRHHRYLRRPLTVTLCFMLTNGELHRLQLRVSRLPLQYPRRRRRKAAATGANTSPQKSIALFKRAHSVPAAAAAVRQQQQLLLRSHVYFLFTRDVVAWRGGETAANYCLEKCRADSHTTVATTVAFHPFDCFLQLPFSWKCTRQLCLESSPQAEDQQQQQQHFCKPQRDTRWELHEALRTAHGTELFGGKDKNSCEGEKWHRNLDSAAASTVLVSKRGSPYSCGEATPPPDPSSLQNDNVILAPLRLILLNSREVLVELREPRIYGVLQYRKACNYFPRRRDRDRGSDEENSSRSCNTRVEKTTAATQATFAEGEESKRQKTKGSATAAEEEALAPRGGPGEAKAADRSDVGEEQGSLRFVCRKRKRRLISSMTGGVGIWKLLLPVSWHRWKRQRTAASGSTPSSEVVARISAAAPGGEGEGASSGGTVRSQPASVDDRTIPEALNPHISTFSVDPSRDALLDSRTLYDALYPARLRCSLDARKAEESSGMVFQPGNQTNAGLPIFVRQCGARSQAPDQLVEGEGNGQEQRLRGVFPLWVQCLAGDREQVKVDGVDYVFEERGTEACGRKAAATAAASPLMEEHARRLDLKKAARRFHFHLWDASQHVMRLPDADAGVTAGNNHKRPLDCLVVTCSVVSLPRSQYQEQQQEEQPQKEHRQQLVVQRQHRGKFQFWNIHHAQSGKNAYVDSTEDDAEELAATEEQRLPVFYHSEALQGDVERRNLPGAVAALVVAIWKVRAVSRKRRLTSGAAMAQSSGLPKITADRWSNSGSGSTSDTWNGSGASEAVCAKAQTERSSSLTLLCEYTYTVSMAAGPQETQRAAVAFPSARKEATQTFFGALSPERVKEADLMVAQGDKKGKRIQSAGLLHGRIQQHSEGEAGVYVRSDGKRCVERMEDDLSVESVTVAAATPAVSSGAAGTHAAAAAAASGGNITGWWIGVAIRRRVRKYVDVCDKGSSGGCRQGDLLGVGENLNASGCTGRGRRDGSGNCSSDSCTELLLLRCYGSRTRHDSWRLEKAGRLSWTQLFRTRAAATTSAPVQGMQLRCENEFCKGSESSEPSKGQRGGRLSQNAGHGANPTTRIWEGADNDGACPQMQENERRRQGQLWKQAVGTRQQEERQRRHPALRTELLLTSTHLWVFTTAPPKIDDVDARKTICWMDDELRRLEKRTHAGKVGGRPRCCCPRRVLWAVPLPPFSLEDKPANETGMPLRFFHLSGAADCSTVPFIPADAPAGTSSDRFFQTLKKAGAKQKPPTWPENVEISRVFLLDDLLSLQQCREVCCSAIRRNRSREAIETAHAIRLLARLRASLRSVLRKRLAAMASSSAANSAASPRKAAAAVASAAAVWNYQPLVVAHAFPGVGFGEPGDSAGGAAAKLLGWLALQLAEGLAGYGAYAPTTAAAELRNQAASGSPFKTAARIDVASTSAADGRKEEIQGAIAAFEGLRKGEAQSKQDLLTALFNDCASSLRGRDAEADRCTGRAEASLSGSGHVLRSKTSSRDTNVRSRRSHSAAVSSSRLRGLFEALTEMLSRSSLARQGAQFSQGSPRFREKRVALVQPQQQQQGQHCRGQPAPLQSCEQTLFSDRLTAASVVGLVVCWRLRQLIQRRPPPASSGVVPSYGFLGWSSVWAEALHRATAAQPTFSRAGPPLKLFPVLHKSDSCTAPAADIITSRPHCDNMYSASCNVEKALQESPLGYMLSGGSEDILPIPEMCARSLCIQRSKGASALASKSPPFHSAAANHVPTAAPPLQHGNFAIPLLFRRSRLEFQQFASVLGRAAAGATRETCSDRHKKVMPARSKGQSCYSFSVVCPALSVAEAIRSVLQHNLEEVVSDAVRAAAAAAAAAEGRTERKKKQLSTKELQARGSRGFFGVGLDEAAEARADRVALVSLIEGLTPPDCSLRTLLQATTLRAAAKVSPAPQAGSGAAEAAGIFQRLPQQRTPTLSQVHQSRSRCVGFVVKTHRPDEAMDVAIGMEKTWETHFAAERSPIPFAPLTSGETAALELRPGKVEEEAGICFLAVFLQGSDGDICELEELPLCCDCGRMESESLQAHGDVRQPLVEGDQSETSAAVFAAAVLQRQDELVRQLQQLLRLTNGATWRLAVAGSLLRLAAAALERELQRYGEGCFRRLKWLSQPNTHRIGQHLARACAQASAADGGITGEKKLRDVGSKREIRTDGKTGRFTRHRTTAFDPSGKRRSYETSTSEVWTGIKIALQGSFPSCAPHPKGIQAFQAYLLRCATAVVEPLAPASSPLSQGPAAGPQTPSAPSGDGNSWERPVSPAVADSLMKLVRAVRWNALLPFILQQRVVGEQLTDNGAFAKLAADVATGKAASAGFCRQGERRRTCSAAVKRQHGPLKLLAGRHGVVVVRMFQSTNSAPLSLVDALAGADVCAAASPVCREELAAAAAETTAPMVGSALATHAAAAAVAARVGIECLPSFCRLNARSCYPPLHASASKSRQQRREYSGGCVLGVARPSAMAKRMGLTADSKRSSAKWLPSIDSQYTSEKSSQKAQPLRRRGETAAVASEQHMVNFLSFIGCPVRRVVVDALTAGVAAQHELLCCLAAGASCLQELLLRQREPRGHQQQVVQSDLQQQPQAGKTQERRRQIFQLHSSEAQLIADGDRIKAGRRFERLPQSRSPITEKRGELSAANSYFASAQTAARELARPKAKPGFENQLVFPLFEALNASLPLTAGLCCVFCGTHQTLPPVRFLEELQQLQQQKLDQHLQQHLLLARKSRRLLTLSRPTNGPHGLSEAESEDFAGRAERIAVDAVAGSDLAGAPCCHLLIPRGDVEERSAWGKANHLLLLMMYCQHVRNRRTSPLRDAGLHRRRRSSCMSAKTESSSRSSSCHNARWLFKADTKTYVRLPTAVSKFSSGVATETARDPESGASAAAHEAAAATASVLRTSSACSRARVCAAGAALGAELNVENSHNVLILLPFLLRSLCECQVLKTIFLPQRVRATGVLADFLSYSPLMLHRLAAHSLRCWHYQEERCNSDFTIRSLAAAGVYAETTAAVRCAAHLIARLRQHVQLLRPHAADSSEQYSFLRIEQQRALSPPLRPHQQLNRRQARGFYLASDEEKGDGMNEQGFGSGYQEPNWCQTREFWQRQQQKRWQPQHNNQVSGMAGSHRANRQRHATAAAAHQRQKAKVNGTLAAISQDRADKAYLWGLYAYILHRTASRLQRFYPEVAALSLDLRCTRCSSALVVTEYDADDGCDQHVKKEGAVSLAAAAAHLSSKWRTFERTAAQTAAKVADRAKKHAAVQKCGGQLSLAGAFLQAAARAATLSRRLCRGYLPLGTAHAADGKRTDAGSVRMGAAERSITVALDDGRELSINNKEKPKWQMLAARPCDFANEEIAVKRNGSAVVALLKMCCSILPPATPNAAQLWKVALKAALQAGNVAAATAMVPLLRSRREREKALLHVLATVLVQQCFPEGVNREKKADNPCGAANRAAHQEKRRASAHEQGKTRSCNTGRTRSMCWDSRNSEADESACHRTEMSFVKQAEGVSLATLRAAAADSQLQLSVEDILLRISLSADCGRERSAFAAFQMLKEDFLASGRRSDAALLAFLRAAAIQTQLYAASAAYLGTMRNASSPQIAAQDKAATPAVAAAAAASATAFQYFADAVNTDDCFPAWLLRGLKQLQDAVQHKLEAPLLKQALLCKVACNRGAAQTSWLRRDANKSESSDDQLEVEQEEKHSKREDYEDQARLLNSAVTVMRLCSATVSEDRCTLARQSSATAAAVIAAASASRWHSAEERFSNTTVVPATEAAAAAAAAARDAGLLCAEFEKCLSLMEGSASLCANLLTLQDCQHPPFSFPLSDPLPALRYPIVAVATASARILLLPSLLQPLLLASGLLDCSATVGDFLLQQDEKQQLRGQWQQQQQDLHVERRAPHPAKAAAILRGWCTARQQRKANKTAHSFFRDATPSLGGVWGEKTLPALRRPAVLPGTPPLFFPASVVLKKRWTAASALAAHAIDRELMIHRKSPEQFPYVTASLGRRVSGIARAKLLLLHAALSPMEALQQLLPWDCRAANTLANLGFSGQLCTAIQLADIYQVDVFIPCAAYIAYAAAQHGAAGSHLAASHGCWQLLVQQLQLRRIGATPVAAGAAAQASEGCSLAWERARNIQVESAVCALHSKLLRLLVNVQKQLEQDGCAPPPACLLQYLREAELPVDPMAALGLLLQQGRLREAFALVLRETEYSDVLRLQVGWAFRGDAAAGYCSACDLFDDEAKEASRACRPRRASSDEFLNRAYPLVVHLLVALAAEMTRQAKKAATRQTSAIVEGPEATATRKWMLATIQHILSRYDKASRLASARSAQLTGLALQHRASGVVDDSDVFKNAEVVD